MLSTFPSAVGTGLSNFLPSSVARVVAAGAVGRPLDQLLPPVILLVLCVVAGIATYLMLPGRKEAILGKIGGAIVLACALILVALLVRAVGGPIGNNIWSAVYFWLFAGIAIV